MNYTVDLYNVLSNLSLCLDFFKEGIDLHHQRVARIGLSLAEEIGLADEEKSLVYTASVIHDIGVSTWGEKRLLHEFEVDEPWEHCKKGYQVINRVDSLIPVGEIVLYHHNRFGGKNRFGPSEKEIPLAARIIHLADRVDVLLKYDANLLLQSGRVTEAVRKLAGDTFDPELVTAFAHLARRECFWLNLVFPFQPGGLTAVPRAAEAPVNEKGLKQLAEMFAAVIDGKSPFTSRHSRSVAGVAAYLAGALGSSPEEVFLVEVAGLLHDLGKLSVPDEILEKTTALTEEEYAIIRQHAYYTFSILRKAGLPDPIPEFAAYHHEKMDGSGYPFRLDAARLPLGSRIMAAADVFTALREDRPYRPGMDREAIEKIMREMVSNHALDGKVVETLLDHYRELDGCFSRLTVNPGKAGGERHCESAESSTFTQRGCENGGADTADICPKP
ncbi:MAG TPA: HD domain-containing protein [Bacillota bacterium]|nr:HD domain-containing protein [Bacillota bacterium]